MVGDALGRSRATTTATPAVARRVGKKRREKKNTRRWTNAFVAAAVYRTNDTNRTAV
jgi:hypothetical protein